MVRWIIQENLNSHRNYLDLVQTLEELNIDYLIMAEKAGTFEVLDPETQCFAENTTAVILDFIKNHSIMVYGGKRFVNHAMQWNLRPGSFLNDNFDFTQLKKIYGTQLLNPDFVVGDLFELEPTWDEFFIRPTGNNKLFTGMKISKKDFKAWQISEKEHPQSLYKGKPLMISPLQEIQAEYRFFVVDGRIASGSSYKMNDTFKTGELPDQAVIDYANQMIAHFELSKAYVMDIAKTPKGHKIVEFNNLNCSGFYENDIKAIVNAIQNLEEK